MPTSPPSEVVAYNFNIAETGVDYVVELIGASSYDPNNSDWACPPEAWTSKPSQASIPYNVFNGQWEQALDGIVTCIKTFLASSDSQAASTLRQSQAVCAGFVDGDIVQVWPDAKA